MVKPTISWFGETALLLNWEQKIDPEIHENVLVYEKFVNTTFSEAILETVSTYCDLAIYFKTKDKAEKCYKRLMNAQNLTRSKTDTKHYNWKIPVCYDPKFGLDLETVSLQTNLSKGDIITYHTSALYRIYFIGFLPGFLYLGGLSEKLHIPRKKTPRPKISKGAVAIGGSQTGIYPMDSPGGWRIIGQTPIELFDASASPPVLFKSGDRIQFQVITLSQYTEIARKVKAGSYEIEKTRVE